MVAGSLLKEGRVRYAYLGVLVGDIEELDPSKKAQLPGVDHGVFVSQVTPGRPGGQGGHARGRRHHRHRRAQDGGGRRRHRLRLDARDRLARHRSALVRDGKPQKVAVELGELPSADGRAGAPTQKLGLALQTLTPELAESMGIERGTRGAVVAEVAPGGAAAAAGVREGDVILEVDRQRITTAEEAVAGARARPKTGGHLVRIRGATGTRFITLGAD